MLDRAQRGQRQVQLRLAAVAEPGVVADVDEQLRIERLHHLAHVAGKHVLVANQGGDAVPAERERMRRSARRELAAAARQLVQPREALAERHVLGKGHEPDLVAAAEHAAVGIREERAVVELRAAVLHAVPEPAEQHRRGERPEPRRERLDRDRNRVVQRGLRPDQQRGMRALLELLGLLDVKLPAERDLLALLPRSEVGLHHPDLELVRLRHARIDLAAAHRAVARSERERGDQHGQPAPRRRAVTPRAPDCPAQRGVEQREQQREQPRPAQLGELHQPGRRVQARAERARKQHRVSTLGRGETQR